MDNANQDMRARRRRPAGAVSDRLPPFSMEAEMGTLGSIMLDPNSIVFAIEAFKEGKENFYDLRHQTIYETLVELWTDRDPIDTVSVVERLKAWGNLDQVGGFQYIATLPDAVPSAANIEYYIKIIREKYFARRMIQVCTETVSKLYEPVSDFEALIDQCERDLMLVNQSRVQTNTRPIRELVTEAIVEIEAWQQRGAAFGIPSGFSDYDKIAGGLQDGDMIVLAARPGMGKTSLAVNIATNVAVDSKLPVGLFTLEMTARQLTRRMLFSRAKVSESKARQGYLDKTDYPKITDSSSQISGAKIHIDDMSGLSVMQLRAKARRMQQQFGIKLFVIDYLTLLNAAGGPIRNESRQQEVTLISQGIKSMAKELNVPVLTLCQLNRELEREKNRKPRLSDLRESGSIEQDADLVTFLYKKREKNDEDEYDPREVIPINWLVAKNRNGPTGEVPLTFFKPFTRFVSSARDTNDNIVPDDEQNDGSYSEEQGEFQT